MCYDLLNYLINKRYLYGPSPGTPPNSTIYRNIMLSARYPLHFKRNLRVTPKQFDFILNLIKDHVVFIGGTKPQIDVAVQLKVALIRLGHYGSLASVAHIADIMAVSTGSVVRYTERCIEAIYSL
ncbi:hypothetical protein BG015_005660, partial [Linnemannia schmuckeri]